MAQKQRFNHESLQIRTKKNCSSADQLARNTRALKMSWLANLGFKGKKGVESLQFGSREMLWKSRKKKGIEGFKSSKGWFCKFLNRYKLVLQKKQKQFQTTVHTSETPTNYQFSQAFERISWYWHKSSLQMGKISSKKSVQCASNSNAFCMPA